MSRVYVDACSIIYLVEAASPFHQHVVDYLVAARESASARLVTSRLSRLECRVRPMRDRDDRLLSAYETFFSAARLIICEISASVVERATELRALHRLKPPDAIHFATAVEEGVDVFLAGDSEFLRCEGMAGIKVQIL